MEMGVQGRERWLFCIFNVEILTWLGCFQLALRLYTNAEVVGEIEVDGEMKEIAFHDAMNSAYRASDRPHLKFFERYCDRWPQLYCS